MYAGQTFDEFINQGQRECVVIAEDGTRFLYEYEMPNGTSCVRNEKNRPVSYKALSRFWLRLIEDQFGLDNLLANPQQGHPRKSGLVAELRKRLEKPMPELTEAVATQAVHAEVVAKNL